MSVRVTFSGGKNDNDNNNDKEEADNDEEEEDDNNNNNKEEEEDNDNNDMDTYICICGNFFGGFVTALLRGSHGLNASRARMTKSNMPEGSQTRSWGPEGS